MLRFFVNFVFNLIVVCYTDDLYCLLAKQSLTLIVPSFGCLRLNIAYHERERYYSGHISALMFCAFLLRNSQ